MRPTTWKGLLNEGFFDTEVPPKSHALFSRRRMSRVRGVCLAPKVVYNKHRLRVAAVRVNFSSWPLLALPLNFTFTSAAALDGCSM